LSEKEEKPSVKKSFNLRNAIASVSGALLIFIVIGGGFMCLSLSQRVKHLEHQVGMIIAL